jgi:primosomal protein N'
LVVQSANRANLQRFVAQWRGALTAPPGKRVRVSLDIDPASFC